MSKKTSKVYVAMSGGVDSSVAAALLINQGYECHGVFMITNDHGKGDAKDAKHVADKLGIPLSIVDFRANFQKVIRYFCDEYSIGRTPNPCVYCNKHIKFGLLWDYARENNADYIATGHYIRSIEENANRSIYSAQNLAKDQSYVLSMINKDVIDHILLPIGNYSKDQVRQMASDLKLGVESKPDSQEICFIPDDDYAARLEKECPELCRQGNIVFTDDKILGQHNGIHNYTIGQRRGLGVAMGRPVYVVSLDAKTNTVVLGEKEALMSKTMTASKVNWLIEKPQETFRALVKIRYNHRGCHASVTPTGDKILVEFENEVSAITPGQTAVIYIENENGLKLAGGGWIDSKGEADQL